MSKLKCSLLCAFCIFSLQHIARAAEAITPPAPKAAVPTPTTTPTATVPTPPAAIPQDVDISNLEQEYWRPRIDELEVIQNKRIPKTHRVELSTFYGVYQAEGFQDSQAYGLTLGYNFNEIFFMEASGLKVSNHDSKFLKQVQDTYFITPNFNKISKQYRLSLAWVPVYAKFSFIGRKISHFDTFISGGIGETEANGNNFTKFLGIGEKFFITQNLFFRLEWLISYYNETVPLTTGATSAQNTTKNLIAFGLGWIF